MKQMGTSMKKAVFPEEVVDGLKRWQVKAKKNLARRNNYMARPSLDASLETSLDSSPSFSTHNGALFGLELDNNALTNDGFVEVKIVDEDDDVARKQLEKHPKLGSFGFDMSNGGH